MMRTPKQAAIGALLDEHSQVKRAIKRLDRGEPIFDGGRALSTEDGAKVLERFREMLQENNAAYNWLRALPDAGQPDGVEVGISCLERMRTLMSRLGIATSPSLEEFGATLELNLFRLLRVMDEFMDRVADHASPDAASDGASSAAPARCPGSTRRFDAGELRDELVVRYGEGKTALCRLKSPHAGGWHAEHCLGGAIFVYDDGRRSALVEPTFEDLQTWVDRETERRRR
ncbi:hypothetical protein [Burkholderia cepacia]|uniref:hypothetical protein n=1 Tax=Burkholderia cepacia TaxID=292 RepID=UPI002AB62863|nr:hypothetical protein [Burkholderia cepacia]